MPDNSDMAAIAHAIQLSVTPVFLLLGIGTMLVVMTNRLARVVDRARVLQRHAGETDQVAEALVAEADRLVRRGRLTSLSIALLTTAALLVTAVIAILFASTFLHWNSARLVALLFILAMTAVFAGLVLFLREVFLATAGLRLGLEQGQSAAKRVLLVAAACCGALQACRQPTPVPGLSGSCFVAESLPLTFAAVTTDSATGRRAGLVVYLIWDSSGVAKVAVQEASGGFGPPIFAVPVMTGSDTLEFTYRPDSLTSHRYLLNAACGGLTGRAVTRLARGDSAVTTGVRLPRVTDPAELRRPAR